MRVVHTTLILTGILAACASIAQETAEDESELKPLSRSTPEYPEECIGSRMEAHYVVVEYDITVEGTTENAVIVESSHACFNETVIEAVNSFRFEPRRVGGVPVPVRGQRNKFSYTLAAMSDDVESELQSIEERLFNGDGAGALQLLAAFEAKRGRKLNRYEYASFLWMRGVANSLEKNYVAARDDIRAALATNDLYPETMEWLRSMLSKVEASAGQ